MAQSDSPGWTVTVTVGVTNSNDVVVGPALIGQAEAAAGDEDSQQNQRQAEEHEPAPAGQAQRSLPGGRFGRGRLDGGGNERTGNSAYC